MNADAPSVLDVLQHLIEDTAHQSVLYLGDAVPSLAVETATPLQAIGSQQLLPGTRFDLDVLSALPDADLIIVGDVLDACDSETGLQLLAGLRNQLRARICVLVPDSAPWQFCDLIGLGFKRLANCAKAQHAVTIYSYAIADYNFTRKWNNARFWANPELFGKYWW